MNEQKNPVNGLIYGVDERPPLRDSVFAAFQHLLAIFVAIITPPLIIAKALGLDLSLTGFLVSMSLFASGICDDLLPQAVSSQAVSIHKTVFFMLRLFIDDFDVYACLGFKP